MMISRMPALAIICQNSCLVVQNFKTALIIIGIIAGCFENFGSLEKGCRKTDSNDLRFAHVKNQRKNYLELNNECFCSFFSFFGSNLFTN